MKNIRNKITGILILLIALFNNDVNSQNINIGGGEFVIVNWMGEKDLQVKVYPVGAVFSGGGQYTFEATNPIDVQYNKYIAGFQSDISAFGTNYYKIVNFDKTQNINSCDFSLGYGIYKVDFYEGDISSSDWTFGDSCYVDFSDANFGTLNYSGLPFLQINYYASDNIKFRFFGENYGGNGGWNITVRGRHIKVWEQNPGDSPLTPSKGNFNDTTSNGFHQYPLNATNYGAVDHKQPGKFNLNFKLKYNGANLLSDQALYFYNSEFKINENISMATNQNSNIGIEGAQGKFIINSGSELNLANNFYISLKSSSILTLESGSILNVNPTAQIVVYPSAIFCNKGAIINGRLRIVYMGNRHLFSVCGTTSDFVFNDSTKVIVSSGTELDIPDNSTLYFTDAGSELILDSGSTLKFGENSKLVLQNGARISANYATFASADGVDYWDGIYCEDISQDTIKNCTIENAYSGINIVNKIDPEEESMNTPSIIIENCTIENTTNSQFTTGIYVTNSNQVLIKDNTFTSTNISCGFQSNIVLDYCPQGNINIIKNNIQNGNIGITVIQTSPYIAHNNIISSSNCESGIFLDNANGVIKENTIQYFNYSISTYYSSPYLFKNELLDATENGIALNSYSEPLLRPVNSSSQYWISGQNLISGDFKSSAIYFTDESCPSLDSGYNSIMTESPYLAGVLPLYYSGDLYTSLNFWNQEVPDAQNFYVSGGTVYYEPYLYEQTFPVSENYVLNDIGFGLYDTVMVGGGDNPEENEIYLQAYQKENLGQFADAISFYKQVINNNKNSTFAILSIARIFNCMEKARMNNAQYLQLQTYLAQIKNNQLNPKALRELAEDFNIKAKVRIGNVQQAIEDYTLIYNQNQNTSKGFHALINKESLSAFLMDTTDNSPNRGFTNNISHKSNLFAILLKRNYTSKKEKIPVNKSFVYSLENNYPNPFNPATTIKYSLPKDGLVNLKVYDITGREILVLVNEIKTAGIYSVTFNGSALSSGVYFYRIQAGEFTAVKRMVLIK